MQVSSESSQRANELSALVNQPPNHVKLSTTVRRLLLVAADDSVESDFLAALKTSEVVQRFAGVSELVFFSLQHDADLWIFFNWCAR